MAITIGQNLLDMIAIVIVLDILNDNFDTITVSLLKTKNKIINQIQRILQSKEAKNINKQIIRIVEDLAMSYKENNNWSLKKKAHLDKKCFNYHKLEHYG